MERHTQVLIGNSGARERLVLRSSNPFLQPLVSQKKSASSSILSLRLSTSSTSSKTSKNEPQQHLITFEQEQAAITARNEREARQQNIVSQHHKFALKANNMGVFHERIGRIEKAAECYQVALQAVHKTKSFAKSSPKTPSQFSSCFSSDVVPQSSKTPIIINAKKSEALTDERTLISAVTMCNLGSMHRRNGTLGRAMQFYNLAYKIVATLSCDEESQKLQARLLEYVEGNVKLIKEEEECDTDETDEDEDCSEDDMESCT